MKNAILVCLALLLTAPAWCSTTLRMHDVRSPITGYRYGTSTQGQGVVTSVTNSVAGPTTGVQITTTALGSALVWISPPLAAPVTISQGVTLNVWARTATAGCNCGMKATIAKYSGGTEGAAFLSSAQGSPLGISFAAQNWTATPSATSFSVGDRIVIKWWIIDAGGTMVSGNSVRTNYDGSTAGSNGDTWVQFSENLIFQSEPEIIQNKSAVASSASSVTVPLNATGAGHLLAITVSADEPSVMVTSVSDNAPGGSCNYIEVSNALIVDQVRSGSFTDIWYCAVSNAGATAVTVTISPASGSALTAWVYEVGGVDQGSPVDVSGTSSDPSDSTFSGVSLTTTGNLLDFLLEVSNGLGNFLSITSPWTKSPGSSSDPSAYLTAKGTFQPKITYSSTGASVTSGVAFRSRPPNQPPSVDAGPSQTITLPTNTVTLDGTVTDDGLPNNTLTTSWTKMSGPGTVTFGNSSLANTQATFSAAGAYVLQLTANDSQLSSSSNVTITVNPEPISLSLTPLAAGPNVKGTSQAMTAVLRNGTGPTSTPIAAASVLFTVTGPNATSGSVTTDSTGTAVFTYTGGIAGTDTVTASYTGQNSNSATVSWLVPIQAVSTTGIYAQFFTSDLSGNAPYIFDTPPSAKPVFTQWFPNIAFNPPSGAISGNTSILPSTHPFTDVTTDQNGTFSGTIVAQGNGSQAGALQTNLGGFQAVFSGSLTVSAAGPHTITIYVDNSFMLGIGGGATLQSGPPNATPNITSTPFYNLPIIASVATTIGGFGITINFPSAGTYPFELDYVECCGLGGPDTMSLVMMNGAPGSNGIAPGTPPSGSLSLTPLSPASLATGQTQTFTVLVKDVSGAVVPGAPVALLVSGANQRSIGAVTNSVGQATFQYNGTNAGTDTVQASDNLTGMGAVSNQVKMTWTVAGGSGATTFVPQGWIGAPNSGTVAQGQLPITVASGTTLASGTLTYWPTSNPSAITTLNSNTTGSGTIGTFDATVLASGAYTIQLNATDSHGSSQLSQISVNAVGSNKPGRMTSTVTEFKVPLAGIPMSIARTYDSLDRNKVEDFGNGWKLGTFVDLSVDAQGNVVFNFNGQKVTFFFTPQRVFVTTWFTPAYTAQAGVHGSLTSNGCGGLIQLQAGLVCFPDVNQLYQPTLYTYTDPIGRVYTISSSGQLQSVQDLNGNTLTIAANGITSSVNGVAVPFVRDGSGRITQITDLNGNNYTYSYDSSGNLQSVQYPGLTQAETYTYATDHSLLTQTDPRGNSSSATYFDSTNDGGNAQLDGRLKSVTGPTVSDVNGSPVQYTTQYTYNVSTRTTTTTNPDGGTVTRADDSFGNPLSIAEQVNGTTTRTTTYVYDSNENLIRMTDACGNGSCPDTTGSTHTWTYTYDGNGFQTSVQDPLVHASHKTYNQFGEVLTATDAANTNTQTTTYDGNFNPTQTTDLLNGAGTQVNSGTFDSEGNLLTGTDANNKTTQYAYDPNGNLIQVTDPLNQVTHYGYDAMDRLVSQTDPLNNTTAFTYDAFGRLKTKTDALSKVTTYNYDNNGNKISEIDANNHTTQYQYDAMNRLTLVTYPDTTTKQYRYDFRGNKIVEIDQSGRTTKYIYDLAGELTSVTYAFGTADAGTISYAYDLDGRKATVIDELNNATSNTYDAAGNLISVKDALNNTTTYGYDSDNRKTSVQDPNHNSTNYGYDKRSRLTTITYPAVPPNLATTTQYTYDGMGRVLTTTDQAGKVTTKTFDAMGRITSVADAILPTPNTTNYFYDANGNLTSLQDAAGRVTSYQYDKVNRRSKRTLPLSQFETYAYDAVGNLATKTDFNGLLTTYSYDTLNRLLSKVPSSGTGISFTYTPTGQRLSMTDPSGTTNYSAYDNRDRLLTKTTPEGTLTYTYDAHGNVLTINSSNTNGASLTYTYDALNRLHAVTDNRLAALGGPSTPTTYTYDAAGNLTAYVYPNTVQTGNLFDTLNRLTQTCEATSSPACSAGTKLANYAYTLGAAGNRTNVLELNNRNVAYGYDGDYRLTSEAITADPSSNNGTVNYAYDLVGNRAQMTSTLNAVPGGSFFYDSNDRLTTDTYDANGNTTSSAGIANTYDFEDRMTGHGSLTLTYDGDGNRVSETIGGTTTKFLVDHKNPTGLTQVLDEVVNGAVTRTYAYGYERISENQQIGGNWIPNFYGYDGHLNVRFLSNAAASITDSYDFDAFGMPIRTSGTTPNQFIYSGEWYNNNIGLYDFRARYYNQAIGRFWARDPVEGAPCTPVTFNPYIYGRDNAVNRVDPTGRADVAEYPFLIHLLLFTALVGTHYATQQQNQTVVTSIAAFGNTVDCEFSKLACNLTSLADWWRYPGRTFGANRCEECYDHCIQTGRWPSRAPRTTGGSVRCDYWNFPGVPDEE